MDPSPPHSRNLRRGRHSQPGRAYLVTFCCLDRRPVFRDARLAAMVVEELRASDTSDTSRTLAYVVMPDHVHWLFELGIALRLEQLIRQIKGRTAMRINRARSRRGPLWQAGYHDHAVRAEEDLGTLQAYVLQNPVRAGLAAMAEDYPFAGPGWPPPQHYLDVLPENRRL